MHSLLLHLSPLIAATALLSYNFNKIVPDPYLDEVFHIPQSQLYCAGHFTQWDPKITTPFGLYVLSYLYTRLLLLLPFLPIFQPESVCSPQILRSLNALGVSLVLPTIAYRVSRLHGRSAEVAARDAVSIGFFPLVFFFGGLFYTDVWSTVFVLAGYERVLAGNGWWSAAFSAVSIMFRQTNVLWTAFFCALSVISNLRAGEGEKSVGDSERNRTDGVSEWKDVLSNSWANCVVYNPPIDVVGPPIIIISVTSLAVAALRFPFRILTTAFPFLTVIIGFISFVIYNGSIALGDKSAHPATLHLPQLFYFTLFNLLTSFPLLLSPSLPFTFLSETLPLIPNPARFKALTLNSRILRTVGSLVSISLVVVIIHNNTILHPYLLADNRHYTFYIFRRTILRHQLIRYVAAPIYFGCIWTVYYGLRRNAGATRKAASADNADAEAPVTTIWTVAWTAAVAGSVIGAGLVEFRYFIPGWVIWRLAVGHNGRWRWAGEVTWFAALNAVTTWLFLRRGFEWESEVGKVQRFMW